MRNLFFILFLLTAFAAGAAETAGGPFHLKNGSYLFINEDTNTMRMVDQAGNPIEMQDGVAMELEDGSLIMMKNKKIWRHVHREHKHL